MFLFLSSLTKLILLVPPYIESCRAGDGDFAQIAKIRVVLHLANWLW